MAMDKVESFEKVGSFLFDTYNKSRYLRRVEIAEVELPKKPEEPKEKVGGILDVRG
jgi:hypothetical protein